MFDKQYRFQGRHAKEVRELCNIFDGESKASLFNRFVDVYVNAPLIGFLYGRKADSDNERDPETNSVYEANVMLEQVNAEREHLLFNFQLIMLLDDKYESDEEERINKAFRSIGKETDDIKLFDSYVRGGVDVLYEKLIEDATSPDDYATKLYDFIDEFDDRFNQSINKEELQKLCR